MAGWLGPPKIQNRDGSRQDCLTHYVDGREIKCACVGGSSKVPLGFVSLTKNMMMIAMAVWMLLMGH